MDRRRNLLSPGTILLLGGTRYQIGDLEGCGNNAVVYRASYEDGLIQGAYHQVIIKELFPYSSQGWVYRTEDGCLKCAPGHEEFFEQHRQSFWMGNKANLELLKKAPDQIAGNINSYEAYGTCYSVLSLHGGRTLEQTLKDRQWGSSLRDISTCLMQILDSLEQFHKNGILHLDISPDNILILPQRILLIDYNSVWPVHRTGKEKLYYSVKLGYTSPEVRLLEEAEVGPASDLYALCAVFYQMVTGEKPTDGIVFGNQPQKSVLGRLESMKDAPPSAVWKAAQILYRGLQVVARIRYQSVEELRSDLLELEQRIDGKGITFSALWESSRRKWRQMKRGEEGWFERQIEENPGFKEGTEAFFSKLSRRQNYLLTGSGGMGKTSLLLRIWKENVKVYRPSAPVVCYLSLSGYQEAEGEDTFYIKKSLLRQLSFGKEIGDMEGAMHQLGRLLGGQEADSQTLILLLDGLNEAGNSRSGLLREIEQLGVCPVTSILVTDRTDEVKAYGLRRFQTAGLLPMPETVVKELLKSHSLEIPADNKFISLLTNPMMLTLHIRTMENREPGLKTEFYGCGSAEDLVESYLDGLQRHEVRTFSGNRGEQLGVSYTLQHVLPAIAGEMERQKKSVLMLEELCRVTEKQFKNLRKKSFAMAFPKYLGKSREMLQGIRDEKEWFDYAVAGHLRDRMNLLVESEQGNWRLVHENFSGCLVSRDRINRKKIRSYGRKLKIKYGVAGALLFVVLGISAMMLWSKSRPFPATREEIAAVDNAMERLSWEIYVLDAELYNQEVLLEEAEWGKVLDGEEKSVNAFERTLEVKRRELANLTVSIAGEEDCLMDLNCSRNTIPTGLMRAFFQRPDQLSTVIEAGMDHLEEGLAIGSIYYSRDKREKLIDVYRAYLKQYARLCYLEIMQIILPLEREHKEGVLDMLAHSPSFSGFVTDMSVSFSEEDLESQRSGAQNSLEKAENEMRLENYSW